MPGHKNERTAEDIRREIIATMKEILTSDGKPFQERQIGTGELARASKVSCFK